MILPQKEAVAAELELRATQLAEAIKEADPDNIEIYLCIKRGILLGSLAALTTGAVELRREEPAEDDLSAED